MSENRERKTKLVTIRMDDEDKETLDYLSDSTNRSMSDTIVRACKFFLNTGGSFISDSDSDERRRKNHYIHLRTTESDMNLFNKHINDVGISMSDFVRKAVKAYYKSLKGLY